MTICNALKKMSAILTGVMMFGVSANALVLEDDVFYDVNRITEGWKFSNSGSPKMRMEFSVDDGKFIYAGAYNYAAHHSNNPNCSEICKDIDNIDTKYVSLGMTIQPTSDSIMKNHNDGGRYLISLLDDKGNIAAKIELAGNYKYLKVNDTYVSTRNWILYGNAEEKRIEFVIDYMNNECYPLVDGVRVWYEEVENSEGVMEKTYLSVPILGSEAETGTDVSSEMNPITKFSFKVSNNYTSTSPMLIDDIKFYSYLEDGYIFEDTFDDPEKTTIEDYGYYAAGGAYIYRAAEGWRMSNYSGANEYFKFERTFDEINSGKVAFDFTIKSWNTNGDRQKMYSAESWNLFALSSADDTKRAYVWGGSSITLYDLRFNADNVITKLGTSVSWISDSFSDFRVVVDLDENVYNMYAKNENTGDYMIVNPEPVALVSGADETDIAISKISFAGWSFQGDYEISGLKVYTLEEGYTTPVIMKDGRNNVTELKPGETVDIYSAGYNAENAKLIVCFYDENDKFVAMDTKDFTDLSNGIETGISNVELLKFSYTFPEYVTAGSKFKAFVWNGIDDMLPLTETAEIEMPEME